MTLYVCYKFYDSYEERSFPLAVFDSEDKAKMWLAKNATNRSYTKLELNND